PPPEVPDPEAPRPLVHALRPCRLVRPCPEPTRATCAHHRSRHARCARTTRAGWPGARGRPPAADAYFPRCPCAQPATAGASAAVTHRGGSAPGARAPGPDGPISRARVHVCRDQAVRRIAHVLVCTPGIARSGF